MTNEPWHLEKKVPISIIGVLVLQLITVVVWGVKLDSKIEDHERRIAHSETLDERSASASSDLLQRMTRIEEKQDANRVALERIEVLMQNHIDRGRK